MQDRFNEDMAEFENVLLYLLDNPGNTEEINKKLQRVKGQLAYAKRAFDGALKLSKNRVVFVVTGTTDSMLFGMDEITRLYTLLHSK